MEIFKYHIRVPIELFPLIAHAVKYFVTTHDITFESIAMGLDQRSYEDGNILAYLSQINDLLQLRQKTNAVIEAYFEWNKVKCQLFVGVMSGVAEFYMKVGD